MSVQVHLSDYGATFATRERADGLCTYFPVPTTDFEICEIDFTGVRAVAPGFLDELLRRCMDRYPGGVRGLNVPGPLMSVVGRTLQRLNCITEPPI